MSLRSSTGYLQIATLKKSSSDKQFNAVKPPALLPEIATLFSSINPNLINSSNNALQS